jgi:polyisoprenoid-binding protein YceI
MAWVLDASHSQIGFSARHMMLSTVRGGFSGFSGTVDFNEANPASSTVDVVINTASLSSGDEKRDGHLKSADFFDVEKYPTAKFVHTSVQVTGANTAKLHGNLTIKDVTHPVVLDVEYHGQQKAPWGTTSAGFTATTTIERKSWGLNWNAPLEAGGVLVGEKIKIEIDAELVKQ